MPTWRTCLLILVFGKAPPLLLFKFIFYKDKLLQNYMKGGEKIMLDLLDVIKRYNEAKSQEDDMVKDIELQKIQAEFIENNEYISSTEKIIKEKDDEINSLRLDNERLRDSNAQLRVKQGTYVEPEPEPKVVKKEEITIVKTFDELAEDF